MKILLVDDDSLVREMTQRMLVSIGHEVVAAEDGLHALGMLQSKGDVDILLTDIMMPGLDGVELARRVISVHPAIRLVFISAFSHVDMCTTDLEAHGFVLIQKPFRKSSLAAAIEETSLEKASHI